MGVRVQILAGAEITSRPTVGDWMTTMPPVARVGMWENGKSDREKLHETVKDGLRRGELHQVLIETLRIVDPKSAQGKHFNEVINRFCKEFIPKRYEALGFRDKPPRFLLSDDPAPNAAYLKDSAPPTFILTKGLLEKSPQAGKRFIERPEELAQVILHEFFHYYERKEHPKAGNSKYEEGGADVVSLVWMHEEGLNPVAGKEVIDKRAALPNIPLWRQFLDEHPTDINSIRAAETTLAKLRQEKGEIGNIPLKEPFRESDDISRAFSSGTHISFVQQRLGERFQHLTLQEKIDEIKDLIQNGGCLYHIRVSDLREVIEGLTPEGESEERLLSRLADFIVDLAGRSDISAYYPRALSELYGSVAKVLTGSECTPVGYRLERLKEATEKIINSLNSANDEEIITLCREFVELAESESSTRTLQGLTLLEGVSFPSFPPPTEQIEAFDELREALLEINVILEENGEEPLSHSLNSVEDIESALGELEERQYENTLSRIIDETEIEFNTLTSLLERAKVPPAWQRLRELSEDEYVYKAAMLLGLSSDWIFHDRIFKTNPEEAVRWIAKGCTPKRYSNPLSFASIAAPPILLDKSHNQAIIFDERGFIKILEGIKDGKFYAYNTIMVRAGEFIKSLFSREEIGQDVIRLASTVYYCSGSSGADLAMRDLIGVEFIRRNYKMFLEVNRHVLRCDDPTIYDIVQKFFGLLNKIREKDPLLYEQIIREVYRFDENPLNAGVGVEEAIVSGWNFSLKNPYLNYLLSPRCI
ncbi:MAG: hypothetical protein D6808_07720, partial [Candidatus Dadabacteria bacterium]